MPAGRPQARPCDQGCEVSCCCGWQQGLLTRTPKKHRCPAPETVCAPKRKENVGGAGAAAGVRVLLPPPEARRREGSARRLAPLPSTAAAAPGDLCGRCGSPGWRLAFLHGSLADSGLHSGLDSGLHSCGEGSKTLQIGRAWRSAQAFRQEGPQFQPRWFGQTTGCQSAGEGCGAGAALLVPPCHLQWDLEFRDPHVVSGL